MSDEHDLPTLFWKDPEERFRLLVESVRDYGIFMLDSEGRIASWNAGAARINGYTASEIIGAHFSIFYPSEAIAAGKPERELAEAAKEGRLEDEGWRVRKDGSRFWANVVITALRDPVTGELQGYGKVTRDLTERKKNEEDLRHSEEQFRLLVETVEDYAIFLLDLEGHVMTWNLGAHRAKGYTASEIIGQSFERFYTAEDRAAGKPAAMLERARTHGWARDQGVRVRKDGTQFPADVLITAIHDHTGALRGFSKVTRDLTEQIRAREMETAKLAAEQASKTKDEFLAILSHELRTPLTPVLSTIGYLLESADSLPVTELREHLETIRKNVLLEAQLVDDLLDLTRISRGKIELQFEAVNAQAAIEDAIAITRADSERKEQRLNVEFGAAAQWVWADATRLRQVFWNLLNNAVKFTPAGGLISVRTTNPEPGRLLVEISDTGIGIAPDQLDRIFAAFEQAERAVTRQFGGLGLGLAITRRIVHVHNGAIRAVSEGKGKGATFCVTLKCMPAPASGPQTPSKNAHSSSEPLRILLVDDHEDTRHILARLLSRRGHKVTPVGNIAAGKEMMNAEKFDVLISDIGLPDGSGHELMSYAKKRDPALRGIALSGFGMEDDMRRSTDAGFDYHLTKPVDGEVLDHHLKALQSAG